MDCEKYMCRKNVYSLQDWRKEMLRLRKEHAPQYETHPDYVKTAQCKESIVGEKSCNRFTTRTQTRTQAPPRPPQASSRPPQTPPKPTPPKGSYEEYIANLNQYKSYKYELIKLKSSLARGNREILMYIREVQADEIMIQKYMIELKKKEDAVFSSISDLNMTKQKRNSMIQAVRELKTYIAHLKSKKEEHELNLKTTADNVKKLVTRIEILTMKTEHKPVPPPGYTPPKKSTKRSTKTSTKPSTKPPTRKRCPNGYKRNKTTKECDKK